MIFPVLLHIVGTLQAATNPPPAQKTKAAAAKPATTSQTPGPASNFLPNAPLPGAVLATVNGVTIKASDVDKLLWDWAGRGVLEDLILFQLIKERSAQNKISVTPVEIQTAFDKQIAEIQKQVPAGQDIEAFIREKGFPKSRLYLHIQADLLMTRLVDLKFKPSDYISVSTLVIKPKGATEADNQEAAGRAHDIYNRLKKGEDWDAVMKSTDQPPQAIQTHGVLGWRAIDAFPGTAKAEMKTLKIHEYTNPVQTQNGLQIFRIDDYGANATPAALEGLKKEYEERAKQSLAQELQKGAKITRAFGKPSK